MIAAAHDAEVVWLLRGDRPEKAFGGGANDKFSARGDLAHSIRRSLARVVIGGDETVGLAKHSGVEAELARHTGSPPPLQNATPFLPGLSPVAKKSLTARQDAANLTSNGGLVVLREAARRLGFAAVVADPLPAPATS